MLELIICTLTVNLTTVGHLQMPKSDLLTRADRAMSNRRQNEQKHSLVHEIKEQWWLIMNNNNNKSMRISIVDFR